MAKARKRTFFDDRLALRSSGAAAKLVSTVAPHRRRSINNHDNADNVITIVVVGDSEVTTSAGLFDVE